MNKSYLLVICLLLTPFTGCLGFGDNQDKDEENIEEIIDGITNGGEKPEDNYACEINSEGYCIFTGIPHQEGLEPGTDNVTDREGNYLFGVDEAVAVNSEGTILQARGTPAFDGDKLIQSSQEGMSEDEKAFHKVMAIMFPIRNALMYDIESVTQDEWKELVNEFEIREIKETTFTDGQTPKDNYYGRQGIFDLAKDPNDKDIHHDVMKFLEESGLYLLCHVTSDDFAQMLADTHPEGHNPCEDAGITTKIPFEDTESNLTFEILSEHPFECMNGNVFDKFINVFGVYVVGTPGASLEYFNHTAHVTAQYIDNDEDGVPDDSKVLDILVDNNFVVPVWSEEDSEDFWDEIQGTYCEDNIGMAASMYYEYDEWALGGIEEAGTWDTNLEEVWHIITVGWYESYPEYMGVEFDGNGDVIPSNLTDAMDAARGGQFMSIPDEYPEEAWYAYYDDTCDYHCQAHEYFYWILMANIDALDPSITNKCEQSKDEWYVCTKSELETTDVLAYDLFNNQGFNLPTVIPDGSYMSD